MRPWQARRRAVLAAAVLAAAPLRAAPRRELTVAAFPQVDEIIRAAIPHWRRRHPDVEIRIVSRQYVDHHTAMTTALSTSVRLPDVMALEAGYVGRFAQGGGLEDLAAAPFGAGRFRDRFVPFAYDQAVNRSGALVALPTDIGPGTLLYRQDILARAGVDPADLNRSWDSYLDAGARIRKSTGAYLLANVQEIKDIVIRTGVAPGDSLYFDAQSRAVVISPRFVRAFELARRARQQQLDARVAAWSNDWAEGFRRGRLASAMSGAWMAGQLGTWVAPATRGLWRAAQLPEGAFVSYGGTSYGIARHSDAGNKALAWEFIQLMTLDRERQFAAFRSQDAFPALLEAHEDPFFESPVPFLGGQPARLLWRDAARRITATRVHRQTNFADEVVGTELDKVLDHGKDIGQSLADAQRLIDRRARR